MTRRSVLAALPAAALLVTRPGVGAPAPGGSSRRPPTRQQRLTRVVPRAGLQPFVALVEPTPLVPCPGVPGLWLKRDDIAASKAPALAGSKPRKLEWLLGGARQRAGSVVAMGGVGSNQVVAAARVAAHLGLPCHGLLLPQLPTREVHDHLLAMVGAGARLQLVGSVKRAERLAGELARREGAIVLPWGGSSPAGNLGFVAAGLELADQLRESAIGARRLYVAGGTLGSAAGLAWGLGLAGLPGEVVAVRASNGNTSNPRRLRHELRSLHGLLRRLGARLHDVQPWSVRLDASQLGRGYGVPTAAGQHATARLAPAGITLDPVYTAKAAAAALAAHGGAPAILWLTQDPTSPPDGATIDQLPPRLQAYAREGKARG